MDEKAGKKQEKADNVEFGIEFGDMNASKLYELPLMNNEKKDKKKKQC